MGFDPGTPIYGTPGSANVVASILAQSSSSIFSSSSSISTVASSASSDSSASSESSSKNSSSSIPLQPLFTIQISELLYDPIGSDDAEWIELHNTGSTALSLSGLTLKVGMSSYKLKASALSGALIGSGSYFLLPKSKVGFTLVNAGTTVSLLNGTTVLDSITYPALPEGVSYGRSDDGSWHPFCTPTPASANQSSSPKAHLSIDSGTLNGNEPVTLNLATHLDAGTTLTCHIDFGDGFISESCNPGAHSMKVTGDYTVTLLATDYCGNTLIQSLTGSIIPKPKTSNASLMYHGPILPSSATCSTTASSGARITEFLANPSGDETEGEWIELQNTTDDPLSLCGWSVDDSIGGSKPYALTKHQIPPHDYLLIPRKESGIALNNDADTVRLIVPLKAGGTGVLMSVAYAGAPIDQSFAIDGSGAWRWSTVLTPGAVNTFAPDTNLFLPSRIVISAAVPNPKGEDANGEWVEITNTDGIPHWLNGWSLMNASGRKYLLTGIVIAKKQTKRMQLEKTGFSLTNSQDTLELLDENGIIRSILTWSDAGEDEVIRPGQSLSGLQDAIVQKVVDGDTIDVHIVGSTGGVIPVRLLGVDALEMTDPDPMAYSYALKAKEFMRSLLLNKKIELQIDSKRDKYGRALAYLSIDTTDVNALLVQQGLAYVYRAFATEKQTEYIAYESIAKKAGKGFWSVPSISTKVEAKIRDQENFQKARDAALRVSLTPGNVVVSSGTLVHIEPSAPSNLFMSIGHAPYVPFTGSLLITHNLIARVYAEVSLPDDLGGDIRSTVVTQSFIVRQDSYPMNIFVNEVYPSPTKGEQEWIELWNSGDTPASLAGWQLMVGSGSTKWMFPISSSIDAHGYLIVKYDETKLRLRNAGTTVSLLDPTGSIEDKMSYSSVTTSRSFARNPSGHGFCLTQTVTQSANNVCSIATKNKKSVQKKSMNKGLNTKSFINKNSSGSSGLYSGLLGQVEQGNAQLKSEVNKGSPLTDIVWSVLLCAGVGLGWFFWRHFHRI